MEYFFISNFTCQAKVLPGNGSCSGCYLPNVGEAPVSFSFWGLRNPSLGVCDAAMALGKSRDLVQKSYDGSSICHDFSRGGKSLGQRAMSSTVLSGHIPHAQWGWRCWGNGGRSGLCGHDSLVFVKSVIQLLWARAQPKV